MDLPDHVNKFLKKFMKDNCYFTKYFLENLKNAIENYKKRMLTSFE